MSIGSELTSRRLLWQNRGMEQSSTEPNAVNTPLLLTVISGVLAVGIGLFTVAGYQGHIAEIKRPAAETIAYLDAKSTLILAETILCLVFSLVAGLALALQRSPKHAFALAAFGLGAKLFFSLVLMANNWKPGWYFILDPSGSHQGALLLISIAGLQAIFGIAAIFSLKKSG